MTAPVDLTNFREMTDGDPVMEKALFEEFMSSFEEGINALRTHCEMQAAETWRKEAHALKGIALNLGAEKLGDLCRQGQDQYLAGTPAKTALLENIHAEYEAVRQFLSNISSS